MEQPKNTTDVKEFKGKAITPEGKLIRKTSSCKTNVGSKRNHVFLSIVVPDVEPKNMKLDVQPTQLTFTGYSDTRKATYSVDIPFYAEIDPAASKTHHTGRALDFVLQKKELGETFWPRLLKDSKKVHWLKTDFDKWVDEDEQDTVNDDDYMSQMGGMGGGMPGMGMGGDGGFGGIDFSKLGGMGGMGDMGGLGGDDEAEEEDEELEEEEELAASTGAAQASSSSKIEEVE
ncbi:hypothetical protein AMS68_004636 [Peltaster fructicola]|uniref:CS domain-containing protein n=1 Tax=Peltaster fructicola TaxID=286661 RepID=A0A6H0XWX5_9PEZI|nr:hypothetical protein AMS68_004636 [Peltaster fructicola]